MMLNITDVFPYPTWHYNKIHIGIQKLKSENSFVIVFTTKIMPI